MKRDEVDALEQEMMRTTYAYIAATRLEQRLSQRATEALLSGTRKGRRAYDKFKVMTREAQTLKDEAHAQAEAARKRYDEALAYFWSKENRKDREDR